MNAVTIQNNIQFLTQEKVKLIKELYCKKASDVELRHFLEVCESRRLDPVLKQIYAVFRYSSKEQKNVMSIQVGIDGFRAIAARTGEYAGNDAAKFEWDDSGLPLVASVTVYRLVGGQRCPFTSEAYWDEYFPKDANNQFFWKQMPKGQLAKCAESLALRKAFPSELSGLYEPAEMAQAGFEQIDTSSRAPQDVSAALPPAQAQIEVVKPVVEDFFIAKDAVPVATPAGKAALKAAQQPVDALGDTVVTVGTYQGKKLKEVSASEWRKYVREVDEKLKDPKFPSHMRQDAHKLLAVLVDYLVTQ